MLLPLFLIAGQFVATAGQAPRIVLDERDTKVAERAVLISPDEFSPRRVEAISRDFLKAEQDKFAIRKLSIFVDEHDARRTVFGKSTTDVTYAGWRQDYEAYGKEALPMAQTIAIRGDAVLRWRDAGGRIGRKVLAGSDPLLIRLQGHTFEILELAMWKLRPYVFPQPTDPMWVSAAVQTPPTSLSRLRAFAALLLKRFERSEMSISFRNDTWFLTNEAFPVVYRFGQALNPPTEREYRRAFSGHCYIRGGRTSCDVRGEPAK